MNQRDSKIVTNIMIMAVARGKSPSAKKRSQMLRMIMPHLSRESGDALADAISKGNSHQFTQVWNKVRDEIAGKIGHHRSHASAADTGVRDDDHKALYAVADNIYENFGRWLAGEPLI